MHALNVNNPTKVSNINSKLKHFISTMVICGSSMFEFSVSKDMENKCNNDKSRIPTYLLALFVKELKISVKQGRVVTTLYI